MAAPRQIVDALESVLAIYFSDVRHRTRAAFMLCDELVEMTCKLRARQANHQFNMRCNFHAAITTTTVGLVQPLVDSVQGSRDTRNNMQHANAAATVDDQHCADAILDAVAVIDHCWPTTSTTALGPWMKCALRVVRLYSTQGDAIKRQEFEDHMGQAPWRADNRKPRANEMIIKPGRRSYWQLVLVQSQAQVEAILDQLAVP